MTINSIVHTFEAFHLISYIRCSWKIFHKKATEVITIQFNTIKKKEYDYIEIAQRSKCRWLGTCKCLLF